jgi:uncharacterized membrane protein
MGTYSPIDYVLYLGILLLIFWFFLKFIFNKIKLDRKFFILTTPYILVGVFIRVLADTPEFEMSKYWSITPGVYLLTIGIGLIFLFLGFQLKKFFNISYWIFPFFSGLCIDIFLFFLLFPYFIFPERMFFPILLAFFITFFIYLISKIVPITVGEIFQKIENLGIIFAHLLDGSATFIAYNFYGFGEEHLLPRYLINLAGNNAFIMIPLKLILILGVIYLIERYAEKDDETKLIKFLIFILGIGPGLRDTILPSLKPL